MTKSDFKGKKKGGKPAGPPKRRPPPSHPARFGENGKPQGRKGDAEKKKKAKTMSLVAKKRSKYLEKLDAYSGKKKTTNIGGQKNSESDTDYHKRVKAEVKGKLAQINKPECQIKKAEKRKEYLKKKDTKEKKKKADRRARDADSDSELDEERSILDGPRKRMKVEFERPKFGEVVNEPLRDLKDIAAKMIAKQTLTKFAEKVTGEKFNKDLKKVVIPDVGLASAEELERLRASAVLNKPSVPVVEAVVEEVVDESELTEEQKERRRKREEKRRAKEEAKRIAEEEAKVVAKVTSIANENRTLYTKVNVLDLIKQSASRSKK